MPLEYIALLYQLRCATRVREADLKGGGNEIIIRVRGRQLGRFLHYPLDRRRSEIHLWL